MSARAATCVLLAAVVLATPQSSEAQGHGPIFGLSTPTLGAGGWSLDVGSMGRAVGGTVVAMLRPMASYGITEDVQLSASFPMAIYTPQAVPAARVSARMPATPDMEFTLGWRFHRRAPAIGTRFESTAYVAFDYPTDPVGGGVKTAPGVMGALVTGYASRTVYVWIGGLYRRYQTPVGPTADHPGDLAMYTAVVGYRPPTFQHDYPAPDWRAFVEVVGEVSARDVVAGVQRLATGGSQLFAGPTVLGLYGAWGLSGGVLFPVRQALNGAQPSDRARFALNTTFWY